MKITPSRLYTVGRSVLDRLNNLNITGSIRLLAWTTMTLQWRYNERDGLSNHQPHDWLLNRLFSRRSKKTPKLCVTCLCGGNSPVTGWSRFVLLGAQTNVLGLSLAIRDYSMDGQPRHVTAATQRLRNVCVFENGCRRITYGPSWAVSVQAKQASNCSKRVWRRFRYGIITVLKRTSLS